MKPLLFAAALGACLASAGTLAAQTTDTLTFDELREREADRSGEVFREDALREDALREPNMEPAIEVEETIAPGEYELRKTEDEEDTFPSDTTGMSPKSVDGRTEWLMEPKAEPVAAPEVPAAPETPGVPER